jgi:multidrug efflux pump subunit AcrA (membrane-fusion protein)
MRQKTRARWIVMAVLVLVAAGGGYAYYRQSSQAAQADQASQQTLQTSRVRRGSLVISATGAAELAPARELSLSFGSSGEVQELLVGIGDSVKAGQVLGRIDDLVARQALISAELSVYRAQSALEATRQSHAELLTGATETELIQAQAAVMTAQQKLDDLLKGATSAALAQAQAALANTQVAYAEALAYPSPEQLRSAELALEQAKNSRWSAQMSRDATCGTRPDSLNCDQAQVSVLNAEISLQKAEMEYAGVKAGKSAAEIQDLAARVAVARQNLADLRAAASQADVASVRAQLAVAQDALAKLEAGPTESDIAASQQAVKQAELTLAQAELSLKSAGRTLAGTELIAPMDGVVTAVSVRVGETAGASGTITLADLSTPLLNVYLDESDMAMVALGYEVEVVFDALPDEVFKGRIVRMAPGLVTMSGIRAVYAQASLDKSSFAKPQALMVGMNATVDVVGGRAENVLLAPVEALRDLGGGSYAVFLMVNGEPTLRMVEVGLMDMTYAEIKSGLNEGDLVSTGSVETR